MKRLIFVLLIFSSTIVYAKPDYIEYMDGKILKIKCMICGIDVAGLSEVPSRKYIGKTFERLRIYPNYRIRDVELSDGSKCSVIICTDCLREDTESHKEKLSEEILNGFVEQEVQNGSSDEKINSIKEKYKDIKVVK